MSQRLITVALLLFATACNRTPQSPRGSTQAAPTIPPSTIDEPPAPAVTQPTIDYDETLKAAAHAYFSGDTDGAMEHFNAAIQAYPHESEAYLTRGTIHQERGNWQAALEDFEKARENNPDDFAAWNNIAMLLAACPDDSMRDGDKAAEYALKACQLSEWQNPATVNTLAIAYAEQGEWKYAVDHANLAINNASIIEGTEAMIEDFRLVLKLFEDEKPYRLKSPND